MRTVIVYIVIFSLQVVIVAPQVQGMEQKCLEDEYFDKAVATCSKCGEHRPSCNDVPIMCPDECEDFFWKSKPPTPTAKNHTLATLEASSASINTWLIILVAAIMALMLVVMIAILILKSRKARNRRPKQSTIAQESTTNSTAPLLNNSTGPSSTLDSYYRPPTCNSCAVQNHHFQPIAHQQNLRNSALSHHYAGHMYPDMPHKNITGETPDISNEDNLEHDLADSLPTHCPTSPEVGCDHIAVQMNFDPEGECARNEAVYNEEEMRLNFDPVDCPDFPRRRDSDNDSAYSDDDRSVNGMLRDVSVGDSTLPSETPSLDPLVNLPSQAFPTPSHSTSSYPGEPPCPGSSPDEEVGVKEIAYPRERRGSSPSRLQTSVEICDGRDDPSSSYLRDDPSLMHGKRTLRTLGVGESDEGIGPTPSPTGRGLTAGNLFTTTIGAPVSDMTLPSMGMTSQKRSMDDDNGICSLREVPSLPSDLPNATHDNTRDIFGRLSYVEEYIRFDDRWEVNITPGYSLQAARQQIGEATKLRSTEFQVNAYSSCGSSFQKHGTTSGGDNTGENKRQTDHTSKGDGDVRQDCDVNKGEDDVFTKQANPCLDEMLQSGPADVITPPNQTLHIGDKIIYQKKDGSGNQVTLGSFVTVTDTSGAQYACAQTSCEGATEGTHCCVMKINTGGTYQYVKFGTVKYILEDKNLNGISQDIMLIDLSDSTFSPQLDIIHHGTDHVGKLKLILPEQAKVPENLEIQKLVSSTVSGRADGVVKYPDISHRKNEYFGLVGVATKSSPAAAMTEKGDCGMLVTGLPENGLLKALGSVYGSDSRRDMKQRIKHRFTVISPLAEAFQALRVKYNLRNIDFLTSVQETGDEAASQVIEGETSQANHSMSNKDSNSLGAAGYEPPVVEPEVVKPSISADVKKHMCAHQTEELDDTALEVSFVVSGQPSDGDLVQMNGDPKLTLPSMSESGYGTDISPSP